MASLAEMLGIAPVDGALFPVSEEAQQNAKNMGLLQAGLGILANSRGKSFGQALGAGGLMGVQGYGNQLQQAQQNQMLQAMRGAQMAKAKREADQAGAMDAYIATLPPEQQALAKANPAEFAKLAAQNMLPKNEPYTLGPNQVRMGGNNQVLAQGPAEKTPIEKALEAAGIDPRSPQGASYLTEYVKKLTTHPQPSSVTNNLSMSTEKKYGEQFAGSIANKDVDLRESALRAPELADRANRIIGVLNQGNVITGAGADFKLQAGKALKAAGIDLAGDAIANTETLSTQLAQNTLDAIKASGLGSGTGFSNADRDFLEKAVGGKINLDPATLRRLAELSHRAASKSAERWSARVKEIPGTALEGTGISRDPVMVPGLPGAGKQVKRTGTYQGKRVVEYTDGTMELQ